MNTQQTLIGNMCAVTISREYGSGGGEIARRLAEKLQWKLVDHEFVVQVAHELGVSEGDAESQDEYAQNAIERFLSSLRTMDPALLAGPPDANVPILSEEDYHQALVKIVQSVAKSGQAVIVGRGSQKILEGRRDVLHVRIIAPLEDRMAYVEQREGLDHATAHARIQQKDRQRERSLQANYHQSSSNANLYDLVINTGTLDLDSAVAVINLALERKAALRHLSEQETGIRVGLSHYPGQVRDLNLPLNQR